MSAATGVIFRLMLLRSARVLANGRSGHRAYLPPIPAVLGSMLYDVLHVTEGWEALQVLEPSITALYCVDYFHPTM